jgi:hypothetical protein
VSHAQDERDERESRDYRLVDGAFHLCFRCAHSYENVFAIRTVLPGRNGSVLPNVTAAVGNPPRVCESPTYLLGFFDPVLRTL